MNKRIIVVFSLVITLILGVFAIYTGLNLSKSPSNTPEDTSAAPAYCKKTGINYAAYTPVANDQHNRAISHSMGYTLEIASGPGNLNSMVNSFQYSIDNGMTPILRACVGGQNCDFRDVNVYIQYINNLSDSLGSSRTFYVIAGPNEPDAETWIPGLENVSYPFDQNEINLLGQKNAEYMNAVLSGVNKPNVKILSQAFNMTHPDRGRIITAMRNSGARFNELDAVAGNSYNVDGKNVMQWVNEFRAEASPLGFGNKPIIITEFGMIEIFRNNTPRQQALDNLRGQIQQMRNDSGILGFLLFDSFATNPDPNFAYNFMSDEEIRYVNGSECSGGTPITGVPTIGGGCPSSVTTVFVVDGSLTGGNTTTQKSTPVSTVQIAASTNGGASFNNFNGQLSVSGSHSGSYSGTETTNLPGPFNSGNSYTITATANGSTCATSTLQITGGTNPTNVPTETPGQCPASVFTVFVVNGNVSGANTTTNAQTPVNTVQIAASTNGGSSFNNFNGQLIVSGAHSGTYSGTETTTLPGPFGGGQTYTLTARTGGSTCATSTLNISGASVTTTPQVTPTGGVTSTPIATSTPLPTNIPVPTNTPVPTSTPIPTTPPIQPTSNNGGGISPTRTQAFPTQIKDPLPDTAIDSSKFSKIIFGAAMILVGLAFYLSISNYRKSL